MDIYTRQARANAHIDALVTKGVSIDRIKAVIGLEHGLSEKFVQKRVDLVKRATAEVE